MLLPAFCGSIPSLSRAFFIFLPDLVHLCAFFLDAGPPNFSTIIRLSLFSIANRLDPDAFDRPRFFSLYYTLLFPSCLFVRGVFDRLASAYFLLSFCPQGRFSRSGAHLWLIHRFPRRCILPPLSVPFFLVCLGLIFLRLS